MKKIVSWNIRHGAGSRARRHKVIEQLLQFDADVLVVTEFRLGPSGDALLLAMKGAGYHLSHPPIEPGVNTVLIASRTPIVEAKSLAPEGLSVRHLWLVDLGWTRLCAVYMPLNKAKFPYWEALLNADRKAVDLVIGDFNTGDNALDRSEGADKFTAAHYFSTFSSGPWIDVWRHRYPETRDYSWFSNRQNGFRLDHIFATAEINNRVVGCQYVHEPRLVGHSDHSAIVMELEDNTASVRVTPDPAEEQKIGAVIYAIQDPARPDLVKIGTDTKWPQRLRQARSHSPRKIRVLGLWSHLPDDPMSLRKLERSIHLAFERDSACDGKEWFKATADRAVETVSRVIGRAVLETWSDNLKPYDDWRDYSRPTRSTSPRRLWIGQETGTGRIKLVHSPHTDRFQRICPTYNCFGIRWRSAWIAGGIAWQESGTLNDHDELIVEVWRNLVNEFGFGEKDPRVGWLHESAGLEAVVDQLRASGLHKLELSSILALDRASTYVQTLEDPGCANL